jgi:hypothetical protein
MPFLGEARLLELGLLMAGRGGGGGGAAVAAAILLFCGGIAERVECLLHQCVRLSSTLRKCLQLSHA